VQTHGHKLAHCRGHQTTLPADQTVRSLQC
jgi:hypothetical protein